MPAPHTDRIVLITRERVDRWVDFATGRGNSPGSRRTAGERITALIPASCPDITTCGPESSNEYVDSKVTG